MTTDTLTFRPAIDYLVEARMINDRAATIAQLRSNARLLEGINEAAREIFADDDAPGDLEEAAYAIPRRADLATAMGLTALAEEFLAEIYAHGLDIDHPARVALENALA